MAAWLIRLLGVEQRVCEPVCYALLRLTIVEDNVVSSNDGQVFIKV